MFTCRDSDLSLLKPPAAKEILAEISHARPEDIEDMIQSRLGEKALGNGTGANIW